MLHVKRGIANPKDYAGIPIAKRKFAELELSLLHLQQNIEIPETHLHPTIQRTVFEALASNTRPSLSHIPPKNA